MTPDRRGLEVYLASVNEEIQTTKISSELWFRSPPADRIRENDRFVRSLLAEGLGWAAGGAPPCGEHAEADPGVVRRAYWDAIGRGRDVAVHFGAAAHRTLDEYFTVDAGRSGEAALARARRTVTASSPADHLLRCIDRFSAAAGTSPAQACRRVMSMLAQDWSELVRGHPHSDPELAASGLLREFHDAIEARPAGRRGPDRAPSGPSAGSPPVLLGAAEARELAALYMLSRYCYTAEEHLMARTLLAVPRLRSAILAAHLQLTAGSREPLGRLAAGFGTPRALLPFTEGFVNRNGYDSWRFDPSPNPKLITVICNNVLPAVGGELLRRGLRADALDSEAIRAGVVAARRRHVFEIMIALFDHAGGPPDTVVLSGFNLRVCPALAPFSAFLERWLPYHFDRFSP